MFKYLRLILFPLSFLYALVVILRNKAYDLGIFKSFQFDLPVICVGNLAVGGTGKTPVTEYLVGLLSDYRIAILSRGYGRETRGFILADEQATAASLGDEPLQYYHKFPGVTVAVCEDRVKGIRLLEKDHDLIILDDAFQHRPVRAGYSILLFDYSSMHKRQWMLPTGNLREPFYGYKRASQILITKSPLVLSKPQRVAVVRKFNTQYASRVNFSYIQYAHLKPVYTAKEAMAIPLNEQTSVFLLTGIANTAPLLQQLKQQYPLIKHHSYPDHHRFSLADIRKLADAYHADSAASKIIITTEKDAQRLLDVRIKELLVNLPVFYLPIAIQIQSEDKENFNSNILNYVSNRTRNRTIY